MITTNKQPMLVSALTELKVIDYSKENYSYPFPDEITIQLIDETAQYIKKDLPETQSVNIDDLCIRCDKPINGKKYYWCKLGPLHKNCLDMSKLEIIEVDD